MGRERRGIDTFVIATGTMFAKFVIPVMTRSHELVPVGEVDTAPEALVWDGPDPDDDNRRPEPFLRPRSPSRSIR